MPIIPTVIKNNPKLQYLHSRYQHTISLAIEKTAAHLKNPQQYPLPSGSQNLEKAFSGLIGILPKRKQDKFVEKLNAALNASTAQRQQKYGDLAAVDLHSNKSIADQIKALPVNEQMRFTDAEITELHEQAFGSHIGDKIKILAQKQKPQKQAKFPRQAAPAAVATTLKFVLDTLTCNKTSEIRKDEISISAFALSSTGVSLQKNDFFKADFKESDSKSIGAAGDLFSFLLDDSSTGTGFPQSFSVGLFMTEKDLIHNVELGNKIVNVLAVLGVTLIFLGTIVGPAVGISTGNVPLGLLIMLIFTIAGGICQILSQILPVFFDDTSSVATDELVLQVLPNIGDNFARTFTMSLTNRDSDRSVGAYTATGKWVVS
jgi:hypothetical protein